MLIGVLIKFVALLDKHGSRLTAHGSRLTHQPVFPTNACHVTKVKIRFVRYCTPLSFTLHMKKQRK